MVAKPTHQNIAEDGHAPNQLMLLKNHPGFPTMATQGPRLGNIITTGVEYTALSWANKTIKRPKQGGFTSARSAKQHGERTRGNRKIHWRQRHGTLRIGYAK
jgi:hypothetical protein